MINEIYGCNKDTKECCICYCERANVLVLPCKHMCMCYLCSKVIKKRHDNKKCPICRESSFYFINF